MCLKKAHNVSNALLVNSEMNWEHSETELTGTQSYYYVVCRLSLLTVSATKLILHKENSQHMNHITQRSCCIRLQSTVTSDCQIRKPSECPVNCLMEQMVHCLSNGLPLWLMGAKFPRIAYSSTGCIQPTLQSATALVWLLCSLTQGRQISSIWRRKKRAHSNRKRRR